MILHLLSDAKNPLIPTPPVFPSHEFDKTQDSYLSVDADLNLNQHLGPTLVSSGEALSNRTFCGGGNFLSAGPPVVTSHM